MALIIFAIIYAYAIMEPENKLPCGYYDQYNNRPVEILYEEPTYRIPMINKHLQFKNPFKNTFRRPIGREQPILHNHNIYNDYADRQYEILRRNLYKY